MLLLCFFFCWGCRQIVSLQTAAGIYNIVCSLDLIRCWFDWSTVCWGRWDKGMIRSSCRIAWRSCSCSNVMHCGRLNNKRDNKSVNRERVWWTLVRDSPIVFNASQVISKVFSQQPKENVQELLREKNTNFVKLLQIDSKRISESEAPQRTLYV